VSLAIISKVKRLQAIKNQKLQSVANGRELTLPPHLAPALNESPIAFLRRALPHTALPTGPRHLAVWDWLASLAPGESATPRIEIWPRGGAKSTIAELACVYLACTLQRRFVLYCCGTQEQADLHIQAIAALLESMGVPRALNAYNRGIGWNAQKLQTANGFGVIGVGLNGRIRGARLGEFRPDLIVLDDIDETHDSKDAVAKKLRTVTSAVLAAGAADATVLFVQNRIHKDSAIAQVADGRAEILLGATITQEPAVKGLETTRVETAEGPRYRVTGGQATWEEGQPLTVVEDQINQWGLLTFLSESQHDDRPDGGLWSMERDLDPYRTTMLPTLTRIVIGIDPSGSGGTEAGVVAVGRDAQGHGYVLADDSMAGSTNAWVRAAIARYHDLAADTLVAEINFGGDMVSTVIKAEDSRVGLKLVTASRGKQVRAEPVQQVYERGLMHHVGHFPNLEAELCTWQPGMKSPNRLDALVWAVTELGITGGTTPIEFRSLGNQRVSMDAFAQQQRSSRFRKR